MSRLQKESTYPITSWFKDRQSLEKTIARHHPQKDSTILLACSNSCHAFYDPKKDEIRLIVYGKNKDELIEAEIAFFRMAYR